MRLLPSILILASAGMVATLFGVPLPVAAPGAVAAQEAPVREVSEEESQALEGWAREILTGLPDAEDSTGGPEARDGKIYRLWALYLLSVDHSSRVDDARGRARDLLALDLSETQQTTVQALTGALEVVRAKHSRWPPNKLKYLRKGMEILDSLVDRHPSAPDVRYLRLVSGYYLPFFVDRDEVVKEDFGALSRLLHLSPEAMPEPVFMAAVQFLLDKAELEPGDRNRLRRLLG